VGQTKTTIELNGNLYDANTGAMLKKATGGRVVDGFFRGAAPAAHSPKPKPAKSTTRKTTTTPKTAHKTEHSQTLMRHVVSKPKISVPLLKASQVKEIGLPAPDSFWQDRKRRAMAISKSSSISRFSISNSVNKTIAPLAVRPHPSERAKKTAPPSPPQIGQIAITASAGERSFQKALQSAQSHNQKSPHKIKARHRAARKLGVSSRALNIATISLVLVLLTGFIAYQNVPSLSVRLASSKAGFHAALPDYTPSGFGMTGPINTSPGVVTISFRSNSDERSYNLTQKQSNWTSDSLFNNFVAANKNYQILQDKGKTIYIYNGSNATWVNGGTWYQLVGNANLSSDQILRLADSL